jgi:hypothetical protein
MEGHFFDFGWMASGSRRQKMFSFNLMSDITFFQTQGDVRTRGTEEAAADALEPIILGQG